MPVRTLRISTLAAILGALLISCGHGRARTTWEDDAQEGVHTRAQVRTSTRAVDLAPTVFTLEPAEVAAQLERALLVFGARRRASGRNPRSWTDAVRSEWAGILGEVERAFTQPPGTFPSNLLIQVRVILETEMETMTRSHGPAPETLSRRLALAFSAVSRRLRAQRATSRPEPGGTEGPGLKWPVSPIIVTSSFGYRRDPIFSDGRLGFHAGVDLAGRRGDPVVAAKEGEVIGAGWKGGYGRAVFIQHRRGYVTIYAHLSKVLVERGAFVSEGTAVGLMGSSGRATGSHLHFEVRHGSTPVDPVGLLRRSTAPAPVASLEEN